MALLNIVCLPFHHDESRCSFFTLQWHFYVVHPSPIQLPKFLRLGQSLHLSVGCVRNVFVYIMAVSLCLDLVPLATWFALVSIRVNTTGRLQLELRPSSVAINISKQAHECAVDLVSEVACLKTSASLKKSETRALLQFG